MQAKADRQEVEGKIAENMAALRAEKERYFHITVRHPS